MPFIQQNSSVPKQLAKHFHEVFFGGNWTASNLKNQLADVTWQQATAQVTKLNTIATLTVHMSYFVPVILAVLRGGQLDGNDKLSFNHPPINSEADWRNFLEKTWADAEDLAAAISAMPEERLWEPFTDEKWGSYCRNLLGVIEHTHYHLGQIAIIKKLL